MGIIRAKRNSDGKIIVHIYGEDYEIVIEDEAPKQNTETIDGTPKAKRTHEARK